MLYDHPTWAPSTMGNGPPDLSEVCLVGGDLTEFSAKRLGSGIRKLDLSFNMIERLKGLELSAETIEEVIVDNNKLQRLELRGNLPKLHTLSLNKNMITDLVLLINTLKRTCPNLRHLSLLGNPACPDQLTTEHVDESDYQLYRYFIIHHLPTLKFLDHKPITQLEFFQAQRSEHKEIHFYQICTPLPPTKTQSTRKSLPSSGTKGKSRQGKRRYKYVGKNSEGNRFIKDTDL